CRGGDESREEEVDQQQVHEPADHRCQVCRYERGSRTDLFVRTAYSNSGSPRQRASRRSP
ncbi:MAG: hypothetical protein PHT99_10040, partial [Methanoregula sp.]|nr:hypothetical protein [Methanoregula sp.]